MKKLCIFGAGGFGKETLCNYLDICYSNGISEPDNVVFMVDDLFFNENLILGFPVIKYSAFDPKDFRILIALGEPAMRKKIYDMLPATTTFSTLIHPSVIMSKWVSIGTGSILSARVVLTCDIKIGIQAQLNLHTTIGHDCSIGDFFTSAPGAHISGNCNIGNNVYLGTGVCVKQGISICDNTTIGMGAVVLKDITEPGVYVGNPLKRIR